METPAATKGRGEHHKEEDVLEESSIADGDLHLQSAVTQSASEKEKEEAVAEGAKNPARPDEKAEDGVCAPTLEEPDEVIMTNVMETKSATKDKEEQPATTSRADEPTLEEADEVITTTVVETKSAAERGGEQPRATSRVDEGTEATRGTAGQAGPLDGGMPL